MSFIPELFAAQGLSLEVRQQALSRCLARPDLPVDTSPVPQATKPYWLQTPHPDLTSASTEPLPEEVDVLIIGSGITGASVARHLLRRPAPTPSTTAGASSAAASSSEASNLDNDLTPRILMLEARSICSGATGRNGGHINEVGYSDYNLLISSLGRESAKKITKFRISHLDELMAVANEEGLVEESQIRIVESPSAFFDTVAWEHALKGLEAMKADLGDIVKDWRVVDGSTEDGRKDLEALNLGKAVGVIIGKAGAVWPYKLVAGILSNLKRDFGNNFQVADHTPAVHVYRSTEGHLVVKTPRVNVKAWNVVHATNGYVGQLVDGLEGRVFPLRGQMSAQRPPAWWGDQSRERSWSLEYAVGFDYLTQIPRSASLKPKEKRMSEVARRQEMHYHLNANSEEEDGHSGGDLMFGGGFAQTAYHGLCELGVTDDSTLNPDATQHLETALAAAFTPPSHANQPRSWQEVHAASEAGHDNFEIKSMWTGIMGFSVDCLPWVGHLHPSLTVRPLFAPSPDGYDETYEIPIVSKHIKAPRHNQKEGKEWISAAYSGEGMVNAWGCGGALASMIRGRDVEERVWEWFPEEMKVSVERVQRGGIAEMVEKELSRK